MGHGLVPCRPLFYTVEAVAAASPVTIREEEKTEKKPE